MTHYTSTAEDREEGREPHEPVLVFADTKKFSFHRKLLAAFNSAREEAPLLDHDEDFAREAVSASAGKPSFFESWVGPQQYADSPI